MSADIITLPTGPNVSAAWDAYAGLVQQMFARPVLQHDADFMARLDQAYQCHWQLYNKHTAATPPEKAATL